VPQTMQHGDLVVRGEAGQHPRGMVVVEELPAHLQVQLPADLLASALDVAGLQLDVLLTIEADRCTGRERARAGIRGGHSGTLAPTEAEPGLAGIRALRHDGWPRVRWTASEPMPTAHRAAPPLHPSVLRTAAIDTNRHRRPDRGSRFSMASRPGALPPAAPPRPSRRALGLGALAVPGLLGLAGCGSDTAGGGQDHIRIVDYYNTPADDVAINGTFEKCAAELGLTFSRERVPGDQLIAKVLQMGSSRTLPDLLMLDNPNVQQVAASGALAPLEQYGITTEGITDSVADLGMHDGTLYGIAPTVNTIAWFYNVELLEDPGVEAPTTWTELRSAAEALTTEDRYGFAFSAIASYEGTFQFMPFLWSNGGDETELDGEGVLGASRFWSDCVTAGLTSRSVVNWGQGDVIDQFK